jgi:predicted adenine nucleotide alpha hydrolase (AANH) superfamily ATPase
MERAPLSLPAGHDRLLLHSCCAPCSGEVMEAIEASGIDYAVYFYNPNIHPRREYELRKECNIRFAEKHGVRFIDADYDRDAWFLRVRGLEHEPERGARCTTCFDMRFERAALYAHEHGYTAFSSSLGISRLKDMAQINRSGHRAASRYPGLVYWDHDWRKGGGANRMVEISKREGFYLQEYCGCAYSMRDTNAHRLRQGRDRIRIGVHYYGEGANPSDGAPEASAAPGEPTPPASETPPG